MPVPPSDVEIRRPKIPAAQTLIAYSICTSKLQLNREKGAQLVQGKMQY